MSGAVPLLPLYAFMALSGKTLQTRVLKLFIFYVYCMVVVCLYLQHWTVIDTIALFSQPVVPAQQLAQFMYVTF